ncbi:MAG: hypothetical protein AAF393_02075 [Pseudomonadota bacterium]
MTQKLTTKGLRFMALGATIFGLAACQDTLDQRKVTGAATGAAIGALGTVLLDGDPLKGAVVGGVVGAIASKDRHVWE